MFGVRHLADPAACTGPAAGSSSVKPARRILDQVDGRPPLSHCARLGFRAPLFSYSYKVLLPQPPYFDIHTKCPGVAPPRCFSPVFSAVYILMHSTTLCAASATSATKNSTWRGAIWRDGQSERLVRGLGDALWRAGAVLHTQQPYRHAIFSGGCLVDSHNLGHILELQRAKRWNHVQWHSREVGRLLGEKIEPIAAEVPHRAHFLEGLTACAGPLHVNRTRDTGAWFSPPVLLHSPMIGTILENSRSSGDKRLVGRELLECARMI
jgi:hypothetical protein